MSTESLYMEYVEFHAKKLMEGNTPLEIAALLVVQALGMYRTVLSEEDYENMVDKISSSRHEIKPIGDSAGVTLQ